MTKRLQFTNTRKWTQAWFRKLKPEHKLFWLYVNDMCDHAGFWNVDFELAELCTGMPVEGEGITMVFKDKIKVLDEDLWWLTEYCIIQSKTFLRPDETSPPRKSMVDLMTQFGVYAEYISLFYKTYPGLGKPMDSLKEIEQGTVTYKLPVREEDSVGDEFQGRDEYTIEESEIDTTKNDTNEEYHEGSNPYNEEEDELLPS